MAAIAPERPTAPALPVHIDRNPPSEVDSEYIGSQPIYVWEVPVRVTHWLIALSIVALAFTGLYIHAPFLVPSKPIEASRQMADVRFWHEIFAIVFSLSIAVRFYWGFVGNSFSSWGQIIPHRREQFYWLREMGRYYSFRRRHPVPYTGHNHLAGLAYTVVSVGLFAQVLTGLLLMGWIMQGGGVINALFGWGSAVPGGIQTVRLLHYILTFLFAAFAIHHVYSAILIDIEERNGVLSSMFSGYKNIKTDQTVEALGLVGSAPEEHARGSRAAASASAAGNGRGSDGTGSNGAGSDGTGSNGSAASLPASGARADHAPPTEPRDA